MAGGTVHQGNSSPYVSNDKKEQFMNIELSQIVPPEDYSYDPDELMRLRDSIIKFGLWHQILLQGDNPPYKIIAGRARFIATKESGALGIEATILPESCPNPHEIALQENLRRHNLPWYDQVELEKELHEMRVAEHGVKPHNRPAAGETGWSQNDTARELGISVGAFSKDMNLALALRENPYLRNVKDKTTAFKIIKRITKQKITEIESLIAPDFEMNQVLLGDSRDILKSFPDNTFDACITDPPWSQYKDEEMRSDQEKLLPIFLEIARVLKHNSFLYLITSTVDFPFYKKELPKLGLKVQDYPIIWYKTDTITHGRAPWQYARDYEPIIVAVKGNPVLTKGTEISSIKTFKNVHVSKLIHPHEKPIELMRELVDECTYEGGRILDPFAGSGVVLEAAKILDRRYIGIEKEKKFFDLIEERLKLDGKDG